MFAGKLGYLVLDGVDGHISADSVVSVSFDNGTESDVLAELKNPNIRLAGTTPQSCCTSPYWFDNYRYAQQTFACKVKFGMSFD